MDNVKVDTTNGVEVEANNMKDFYVVITGMAGLGPELRGKSLKVLKAEECVQSIQGISSDNRPSVPLFAIVASSKEGFLKIVNDNAASLWDCMIESHNNGS